MRRIRRMSADSLQSEKCRGNVQMQQQAQTCGISDGSDTAHTSKASMLTPQSFRKKFITCQVSNLINSTATETETETKHPANPCYKITHAYSTNTPGQSLVFFSVTFVSNTLLHAYPRGLLGYATVSAMSGWLPKRPGFNRQSGWIICPELWCMCLGLNFSDRHVDSCPR